MKIGKKILCLLLCAAMATFPAACGSTADKAQPNGPSSGESSTAVSDVSMGRYIESSLGWPQGANLIIGIFYTPDGKLEMISSESELKIVGPWTLRVSSDGGKSWSVEESPWLDTLKDATILEVYCDDAGNLYLMTVTYTPEFEALYQKAMETGEMPSPDKMPSYILYRVTPDGSMTDISPQWEKAEDGSFSVNNFLVLGNGDIIVDSYSGSCVRYDAATGAKKVEYPISSYRCDAMMVFGDTLAVVVNGVIQQFDLNTDRELDSIAIDNYSGGGSFQLSQDKKSIIRCDATGIYRHVIGGSVWERVVEGERCSLSMPSVGYGSVFETGDDGYVVVTFSKESYDLLQYAYSPDTPTMPSTEMTVYSLYDNNTVRQAIGAFQRGNPDVAVKMNVAIGEQGGITISDAIRSLNTELLAGKGPDILVLDSLPINSYIEKGVLADLSPAINPMIDGGELCQNIARAYAKGDSLYALPTRFAVPQMWGLNDCVDKAKDLTSLADWIAADHAANPDIRQLQRMAPSELIEDFYVTCAPAWRNEDGSIKEAEFAQFLTDIKKIADTGDGEKLAADAPTNSIYSQAHPWASVGEPADQQLRTILYLSQSTDDFAIPDAFASLLGDRKFAFMPGQSQNVYVPEAILGVNANSAMKEMAEDLVKLAVNESNQSNDFQDGYAVNVKALKDSAKYPYMEGDDGMQAMLNIDGTDRIVFIFWPSEEFMNSTMDAIQNLSTASTVDPVLLDMIISETQGFFSGSKSLDETVKMVIERTQAYLAE